MIREYRTIGEGASVYSGTFLDGSWEVDCSDSAYIREWYNNNEQDETAAEE